MTDNAVFVDTNILVAASDRGAPFHAECMKTLARLRASSAELWISRQVIREFLATLSRPQVWGADMDGGSLADYAERLLKFYRVAEENPEATKKLLSFVRDGRAQGKQVHDACIAAVMLSHRIRRILTINAAHFERFKPDLILERLA
jgi:predicted nucleic acid-binding protein